MIDETFEDLAQRELDGTTTPEEAARLHRWLESNDAARAHYAELQRVFDTLKLVRSIEPPAHGITATLQAVRAAQPPPKPRRATVTNLSEFRMYMGLKSAFLHRRYAMSKKVLMGVAAVAVAVIGYFAISGFPPTEKGAATIQGAKRHQVEQMKSEDVVLQDAETQAFLQTDFFNALITDKNFQRLVADGVVQNLVQTGSDRAVLMSAALENAEFRTALANNNLASAVSVLEMVQLSRSQVLQAELGRTLLALERTDVKLPVIAKDKTAAKAMVEKAYADRSNVERAAVAGIAAAAFERQEFVDALVNKNVAAAMAVFDKISVGKNADVQRYYLQASVVTAVDRVDMSRALETKDLTAAMHVFNNVWLGHADLQRIEMGSVISNALSRSEVCDLLANNNVAAALVALEKTEVARLNVDSAALKATLSSPELQKYFNRSGVAALSTLASHEFQQTLGSAAFARVLVAPEFNRAMRDGDARAFVTGI